MKRCEATTRVALATLAIAFLPTSASTQAVTIGGSRIVTSMNSGWRYHADGLSFAERASTPDSSWEPVSVPHTWNARDPFDDAPGYRRGVSWYRRWLAVPASSRGKKIFLRFEGVNQVADVYVNGAFVGEHKGGYTAFNVDVTRLMKFDGNASSNLIAVQVDNSHNPFIPPLSVGYALYGGIYRDVWMIETDSIHLSMTDFGSSGVYVSTPSVTRDDAKVRVRGTVTNETSSAKMLRIVNTVLDVSGMAVAEGSMSVRSSAGRDVSWTSNLPVVRNPHLWSPQDPYLYRVRTEVYEGTTLRDRIENPLGFRWFSFDAQKGFSLNGERLQLRGTNRHQDLAGIGSALGDSLHVLDMKWIKEMGANFVRLAHYPQDPAVLAAADRLGLLVWEEIPVVNYVTPSPEFTANSVTMLHEMIRQHANHPSVVTWGIMNEVYLWSPDGFRIRKQADSAYMTGVHGYARHLDSVARADDPSRPVAMAVHGSDDYDVSRVSAVTDILGQNIYSGWYSGVFADFGKQLDRRHASRPNEVIFVSEYGAEDDYRVNSLEPERFDFSGTWMKRYHESYLRQINARPWLSGTAVWNQFDFSQPETGGSIPYMNQKGLHTWDRTPKDVYFLYKANWNPTPMVHIASRGWSRRAGTGSGSAAREAVPQPVDVYSNLSSVELFLNGRSLGLKNPDDVHRVTWDVPFVNGKNSLIARGGGAQASTRDSMSVDFAFRPFNLADRSIPFREIGINVGGKAQFAEPGGIVWEGDQGYVPGAFGYMEGEAKIFDKDLAIKGSANTPLYFTYLSGLKSYRIDVPDGEYFLELLFAEPEAKPGERVFTVSVNGRDVTSDLDLAAKYGIARAESVNAEVRASQGSGITVSFVPTRGKAILNAIRLRKK